MRRLFAILTLVLIGYAAYTREPAEPVRRGCTESDAFVASHRFVRGALKAPATAEFPWKSDSAVRITKHGGCSFTVSAYVDAENGFGALIRSAYSVDMTYDPGADAWRATHVSVD